MPPTTASQVTATAAIPDPDAIAFNKHHGHIRDTPDHPLRPILLILDDYDSLSARNYRWAAAHLAGSPHGDKDLNYIACYADATTYKIAATMLRSGLTKAITALNNTTV